LPTADGEMFWRVRGAEQPAAGPLKVAELITSRRK
jgi:hypothetical protein